MALLETLAAMNLEERDTWLGLRLATREPDGYSSLGSTWFAAFVDHTFRPDFHARFPVGDLARVELSRFDYQITAGDTPLLDHPRLELGSGITLLTGAAPPADCQFGLATTVRIARAQLEMRVSVEIRDWAILVSLGLLGLANRSFNMRIVVTDLDLPVVVFPRPQNDGTTGVGVLAPGLSLEGAVLWDVIPPYWAAVPALKIEDLAEQMLATLKKGLEDAVADVRLPALDSIFALETCAPEVVRGCVDGGLRRPRHVELGPSRYGWRPLDGNNYALRISAALADHWPGGTLEHPVAGPAWEPDMALLLSRHGREATLGAPDLPPASGSILIPAGSGWREVDWWSDPPDKSLIAPSPQHRTGAAKGRHPPSFHDRPDPGLLGLVEPAPCPDAWRTRK